MATVQIECINPETDETVLIIADEQYPEPHIGFQQGVVLNLIQALDEDGHDLNLTEKEMQTIVDMSDSEWVEADY